MKVKGTAVKTIPEFIKSEHPDKYDEWIKNLPPKSKELFTNGILTAEWYPLEDALIVPTRIMSEVCYGNPTEGAYECGKYSAKTSLTGIYKFYVKMSTPGHIIDRASRIIKAYYEPTELEVASKNNKEVTLHFTKFPQPNEIVDQRIAGWIEKALEISGCKDIDVNITKSLTKGDDYTEFKMRWDYKPAAVPIAS